MRMERCSLFIIWSCHCQQQAAVLSLYSVDYLQSQYFRCQTLWHRSASQRERAIVFLSLPIHREIEISFLCAPFFLFNSILSYSCCTLPFCIDWKPKPLDNFPSVANKVYLIMITISVFVEYLNSMMSMEKGLFRCLSSMVIGYVVFIIKRI